MKFDDEYLRRCFDKYDSDDWAKFGCRFIGDEDTLSNIRRMVYIAESLKLIRDKQCSVDGVISLDGAVEDYDTVILRVLDEAYTIGKTGRLASKGEIEMDFINLILSFGELSLIGYRDKVQEEISNAIHLDSIECIKRNA